MIKFFFLFLFCFISYFTDSLLAQKKEEPAASFSRSKLDFEELRNRFEFMPQQKIPGRDGEMLQKRNFLLSLVSEKLWAEEGKRLGIDTTQRFKQVFEPLVSAFYRDMLFKAEIESKVNITELDYIRAFQKAKTLLKINFLFSSDSSEIFNLYHALNSGIKFDTLFKGRQESEMQLEPIEIEYGKADEAIENVFFSLVREGEFSKPFTENGSWYIFYLRERKEKNLSGSDKEKLNSFIRKLLHDRQVEKIYSGFYRRFFGSRKVEANGELFFELTKRIHSSLSSVKKTTSGGYKLSAEAILKLKSGYNGDSLSAPFLLFEEDPLPLGKFLDNLSYETFRSDSLSLPAVARSLSSYVKKMIEYELLYREARKRDFSNYKEDLTQVEIWKDYYLSYFAKETYLDSASVTEDDALALYNKQTTSGLGIVKLNIAEIVTDSLNLIEEILNGLSQKKDFHELARKYTSRDSLKLRGGEWGLRSVSDLGSLGEPASKLKEGEIFGPLKTSEGYHLIKLLKRVEEKASVSDFASVKDDYLKQARINKYRNKINSLTAAFASESGLKLDLARTINAPLKLNNMMVFKLLGFGGKALAFPVTMPHTEWFDIWEKEKKALP